MESDNKELKRKVEGLDANINQKSKVISDYSNQIHALRSENRMLKDENADLKKARRRKKKK